MRKELIRVTQIALCPLSIAALLYPTSPGNMPLTFQDSGVFLYIGSHILQGQVPYRDIWENKPPGVFYLDALGLGIANGSRWGVWAIEVFAVAIASLVSYKLLCEAFGRLAALIGTGIWLLSLIYVIQGGNLTEEYALPLQFGCLWLAYDSESRGSYGWHGYFIGILLGLSFFLKQNLIGIGFAIGLYIIASRLMSKQPSRLVPDLLPIFLGGLGVIASVVVFIAAKSALPDFWDNAFVFNSVYPKRMDLQSPFEPITRGLDYLSKTGVAMLGLIGWGAGLADRLFNRNPLDKKPILLGIAMIDLPIELILVSLPGNWYGHYYMALLPVLSILAAFSVRLIETGLSKFVPSPRAGRVVPLLVFAGCVVAEKLPLKDYVASFEVLRNIRSNHIVDYVQRNTAPGDCVLMWGLETRVNFLAQRCSPTKYTYQSFPLRTPGYTRKEHIEQFLQDLERNKPKLIIDSKENGFFIDETGFTSPEIERLLKFIEANYEEKEQIGSWVVYAYAGSEK